MNPMYDLALDGYGLPLEPTPFDPPPESDPVQTSLTGAQLYPGETLADYVPHSTAVPEPAPSAEYDPINDDADDLPF